MKKQSLKKIFLIVLYYILSTELQRFPNLIKAITGFLSTEQYRPVGDIAQQPDFRNITALFKFKKTVCTLRHIQNTRCDVTVNNNGEIFDAEKNESGFK